MPLYFAYGSNLDPSQMQKRCTNPKNCGTAFLPNYRFVFAGTSPNRENKGVGSLRKAAGQQCAGLVWSIDDKDILELDAREGYPIRYGRALMNVTNLQGASQQAYVYLKKEDAPLNPPSTSYFQQVIAAYEMHGFDTDVIQKAFEEAVKANKT